MSMGVYRELSGTDICRQLRMADRTRSIPIIMVSARGDEIDRVVGVELDGVGVDPDGLPVTAEVGGPAALPNPCIDIIRIRQQILLRLL